MVSRTPGRAFAHGLFLNDRGDGMAKTLQSLHGPILPVRCGRVTTALPALAFLALAGVSSLVADEGMRTRIILYPYHGVAGANASKLAEDLDVYLTDKLNILYAGYAREHLADYMATLRVEKAAPPPVTAQELSAEWSRRNALLLLSGIIVAAPDRSIAKSSIYFGSLADNAPGHPPDLLHLDLPLSAEQFGSNADSHSAAVLYGLAMDAKRAGLAKDLYVRIAARALEIIDPLLESDPSPSRDLKNLKAGLVSFIADATGLKTPGTP